MNGDGYFAEWLGNEYEATPAIDENRLVIRLYRNTEADGFQEVRPGRHVRVVSWSEVDVMRYVRNICRWQGEPFVVIDRRESGDVVLEYAGGESPVAVN